MIRQRTVPCLIVYKEHMFGYNMKKPFRRNRTIDLAQIIPDLAAIEPCYGENGGNCTCIYTRSGLTYQDKRRLITVLKQIASFYGYELSALRKKYGQLLGCRQNVPLPLNINLVLVPLKMRKPRFEQDGATGYINVCAVKAVESLTHTARDLHNRETKDAKSLVHLTGGLRLYSYYSTNSTEKRLMSGRLALSHHKLLQSRTSHLEKPQALEQVSEDALNRVATVSRILYELLVNPGSHSIACDNSEHDY